MRDKARFYVNSKGEFVPSGTTVIGQIDKPYLRDWAAGCAVDYIESSPVCSCVEFKNYGLKIEWEDDCWYFNEARTAFERESKEAADYGTYIHTLCEYSLTNDIQVVSPHEMTAKFMAGFWVWCYKHNVKVIAMEHEVVTDTYGGRLDLVCEMDGVVTLVDFKTGKGSYYDNWKWQIAGYRQAWNENICPYIDNACDGDDTGGCYGACDDRIQRHGILKFNKETMKVNYKSFDEYQATRPCLTGKRVNGKVPTEKYTRTYEDDRNTFNALVRLWHLQNRGIVN